MKIIQEHIWTLAGILLVIITLSGEVRAQAIYISVGALLFWLASTVLDRDENDDHRDEPTD